MPRIVPALEAHHDGGALGQPIDDLALALIAPLGADHCDIGHLDARPRLPGEPKPPFDRAGRLGVVECAGSSPEPRRQWRWPRRRSSGFAVRFAYWWEAEP